MWFVRRPVPDQSLYTGVTTDAERRIGEAQRRPGARYALARAGEAGLPRKGAGLRDSTQA
jgi:predicted GIY-YIG superfamily endonuclease